jgi:drug/metabolite transporter (DMT)-like permease
MEEKGDDPKRAFVLILLASASFAGMVASVKALPPEIATVETVFFRGIVGVVVGAAIHLARGLAFRPQAIGVNLVRSTSGGLALLCYYGAVHDHGCEIATANLLLKTAPLWVSLLSAPLLGESTGPRTRLALVMGTAGAALTLGPAPASERLGVALALASGLFSAGAYLSVRRLAASDHPVSIVTFFTACLTLATGPFAVTALVRDGVPAPRVLALLVSVGVCGTAGQLFMTNAYRHASAAVVSIGGLAEIGFAAVLSVALFGDRPSLYAGAGGALAVVAGVIATWPAKAQTRPPP